MKFFFFLTSFRSENSRVRWGAFLVEDSKTEENFLVGNSLSAGIFLFKIRAQLEFFVLKTRAMKNLAFWLFTHFIINIKLYI